MSDVKQCDRCSDIVSIPEWKSGRRGIYIFKEHTKAATAYNPTEYELCETCAAVIADKIISND